MYTYTCVDIWIYVCTQVYTYTHVCTYTHECIDICVYIHTYMRTYIYIYTHTCASRQASIPFSMQPKIFQYLVAMLKVRHGGGLTRVAHWISAAPREAGGRACENRVTSSCQFLFVKSFFNGPRGSTTRAQMATAACIPTVGHSLFRLKLLILGYLMPS